MRPLGDLLGSFQLIFAGAFAGAFVSEWPQGWSGSLEGKRGTGQLVLLKSRLSTAGGRVWRTAGSRGDG